MYTFVFSHDKHRRTYNSWNKPTSKQLAGTRGTFDLRMLRKGLSDFTVTGCGQHPIQLALAKFGLSEYTNGHVLEVPTHGDAVWIKLNHDVLSHGGCLKLEWSFKGLKAEDLLAAGTLYPEAANTLDGAIKETTAMNWLVRQAEETCRKVGTNPRYFSEETYKTAQALHAQMSSEHKKNVLRVQVLTEARDYQRNQVLEVLKSKGLTSYGK